MLLNQKNTVHFSILALGLPGSQSSRLASRTSLPRRDTSRFRFLPMSGSRLFLLLQVTWWLALGGWLAPHAAHGQALMPPFTHYPAGVPYRGATTAPRLAPGTAAWRFRTRIREAAQQPANFAGHYVLASWGCGAECLSFAIIDRKTGAVYFNDQTVCCWGTAVPDDFEPVRGLLSSRLLVLTGMLNEAGSAGPHYFTFDHGQLVPVR